MTPGQLAVMIIAKTVGNVDSLLHTRNTNLVNSFIYDDIRPKDLEDRVEYWFAERSKLRDAISGVIAWAAQNPSEVNTGPAPPYSEVDKAEKLIDSFLTEYKE